MAAALHGIKVLDLSNCMPSRSGKTYRAGTGRKRTWMRSYPDLSSQGSNYLSLQRDGVLGLSPLSSCLSIYAEKTTQRCFGITPARSTGKTGGTPILWVTLCPCCPSSLGSASYCFRHHLATSILVGNQTLLKLLAYWKNSSSGLVRKPRQ